MRSFAAGGKVEIYTMNNKTVCVWLNLKSNNHYELLKLGLTFESEFYCKTLLNK